MIQSTQASAHVSADETHEPDEEGWYTARCRCGWSFGPVPSMVEVVDVLMEHAFEMAVKAETGYRTALQAIADEQVPDVVFAEGDLISAFARKALEGG